MATKINDFPTNTRIIQALGPYEAADENLETDTVDLIDGDGPAFAIISLGEVSENATLSANFQTSANGSTWENITGGSIATTPVSNRSVLAITFGRKHRYVRGQLSIFNDSAPLLLGLMIGQCRKQI